VIPFLAFINAVFILLVTGGFSPSGSVRFVVIVSDSEGKATCTQHRNLELPINENFSRAEKITQIMQSDLLHRVVLYHRNGLRRMKHTKNWQTVCLTDPNLVPCNLGRE